MSLKIKFNKENIYFDILTVLCLISTLYVFPYFPRFYEVKRILLLIVLVMLFRFLPIYKKKCFLTLNCSLGFFIAATIIATIWNIDNARQYVNRMIIFSISLVVIFGYWELIRAKYMQRRALKLMFKVQLLLLVINDFVLLLNPTLHIENDFYYFIGNKFDVVYNHLILVGFYIAGYCTNICMRRRQIVVIILLLALEAFISITVLCMSGILCLICMIFFWILLKNRNSTFYKRKTAFLLLIFSTLFIFTYTWIVNVPVIQTLITDILGKSINLSGRVNIYKVLPRLLHGHLIFGYGFGTSYMLNYMYPLFPNTQNGLMEWLWQGGIPAVLGFGLMLYNVFYDKAGSKYQGNSCRIFLSILYALCLIACIEISIGIYFFFCMAIIKSVNTMRNMEGDCYF